MAGAGAPELANGDGSALKKRKPVNLSDHYAIKRTLDETAIEVVKARGYLEDYSLSNVKMGIGLFTCLIALVAQFYPKKFPENKPVLIVCIILYVILNGILQYIVYTKEKNNIMFTHQFPGSFHSTGLAISSKLPRFSDTYTLCISSSDPTSISANPPVQLSKSVTSWFSKDGLFAEGIFWEEVEKLLDEYNSEPRKTK